MSACLIENESSQLGGMSSKDSAYPASERAYFRRVYGSDRLNQLHDGHQEKAIYRYAKPWRRADLVKIQNRLTHLTCVNDPAMTAPGRSAYSLKQLKENLLLYCRKQYRSLRWNQHYQSAVDSVAADINSLLHGRCLQPMSIGAVAASEQVRKNLDKNAGFFAFETGKRSKGENLSEAVEWCEANLSKIRKEGQYGLPLVISHRSSNSKPVSKSEWKWRCRIILMQDIRALLMDGVFAIPFTALFQSIPWGEGGMTQEEVRSWIQITKQHYSRWYSSDYSKFDVSQPAWLLEDVFNRVVRPCFGHLSQDDEALFAAMRESYIHKEIHGFDGIYRADGCQLSGALTTYAYNTIVNEIIDRTVLLMQGCNISNFKSLKCGDDNLTFYPAYEPWDSETHCRLIKKYFGISTTLGPEDQGVSLRDDPKFLSRIWTDNGEERDINEVIFNLVYPERYRDYRPIKTGVSEVRAEALVLLSSCLEQDATMREYFDLDKIYADAQVSRRGIMPTYHALATLGSGFATPWLRWKFGLLPDTA